MKNTRTTTTYRSDNNDFFGVLIIEITTKNSTTIEVWIDECEGGEANDMDWTYIDEFGSKDAALSFIFEEYGPVSELD